MSGDIKGEQALQDGEIDKLGFSEVASRIAASIVDRASSEGLVIGLDGEWGSGKSSLLHLIERSLNQLPEAQRPTIIHFRPWLVGDRDALLTNLFSQLAEKISNVRMARGDATSDTVRQAKRTASAVRNFAKVIGKSGEAVAAAGIFWKPLEWIGKLISGVGKWADGKKPTSDLAKLKRIITDDLRELNHRFIITVDDVDRLEPAEAIELLRLVRSVADFPNINYILCYDADRLAEAVVAGADVKDGAAYLEKIVQLTVMVPAPEPFELRQWFATDLDKIIGSVSDEVRERLKSIIDREGGIQLKTPRSVVRTLDSIRFMWPAVRSEKLDASDLVWLLLIKDGSPKLYRWIETYVASVAATSFGTTTVSDAGKDARARALLEIMDGGHIQDPMYQHMFSEQLPGVAPAFGGDGPPVTIYEKISRTERQAAIDSRRLASPDHYRLYFSLIGPSHAVTQAAFDNFWMATEAGPEETAQILLALHGQATIGSLRKSDILFERLRSAEDAPWTSAKAKNMLLALGRMMDEAYRQHPEEGGFAVTNWDRAERLVPLLYRHLTDEDRAFVTENLFSQGVALGWLTSLIRRETFAHGRFGNQKRSSDDWLLSEPDFTHACDLMVARYQAMSMADIIQAVSRPSQVLFAWNQAGDTEGPRAIVETAIQTDEGLIEVMKVMTGTVDSSDRGRYHVLKRENLQDFLDFDAALSRLTTIAKDGRLDLKDDAQRLLVAAADSESF